MLDTEQIMTQSCLMEAPDIDELRLALNHFLSRSGQGAVSELWRETDLSRTTITNYARKGSEPNEVTRIRLAEALQKRGFWPPRATSNEKNSPTLVFRDSVEESRATYTARRAGTAYIADTECPECGEWVPGLRQNSIYCIVCGTALGLECAHCAWMNPPENDLCGKCGTKLPKKE